VQAKDIMTTTVVTVRPDASIREIANLLLEPGRSGKAAQQQ
jgi:CBS domain-containing protein